MDAKTAIKVFFMLQFSANFASNPVNIYNTNKAPCAQPTISTAMGIFAIYLRGMAINNNTKKEIPSHIATVLNLPISVLYQGFCMLFFSSDEIIF